jgi:hypothetical protein
MGHARAGALPCPRGGPEAVVLSAYGGLVSWLGTGARGHFYRDAESQNFYAN